MIKKVSNTHFDRVEYNPKNSFYKICWYDVKSNRLQEIARWRNSYNMTSGANYGLLQLWTPTFDCCLSDSQGGRNTCGGYNKPIANLEGCLYQLQKAIEEGELVTDCGPFNFSSCGSIESLLAELMGYIQKQFKVKLFLECCNG